MLGIDCEGCGRQVSGVHASYSELLNAASGWSLTACPACRSGRPRATLRRADDVRPGVLPQTFEAV
jgi:hypothetical protein